MEQGAPGVALPIPSNDDLRATVSTDPGWQVDVSVPNSPPLYAWLTDENLIPGLNLDGLS